MTPIGYQTNTMVYGLGGYRFGDYARLGAPLVAYLSGVASLLFYVHVTLGAFWFGLDFFFKFVLGPSLDAAPDEAAGAVNAALVPKLLVVAEPLSLGVVASGVGDGPVDAALNAVRAALDDVVFRLDSYHVDAITGGTDAVVTVEVEMSRGDRTVTVHASDADITRASVTVMVDAFDRLLAGDETPVRSADD